MKMQPVSQEMLPKIVQAMVSHFLFKPVSARVLSDMCGQCVLIAYGPEEVMLTQGEKAENLLLVLRGEVALRVQLHGLKQRFEVERIKPVEVVGEIDCLLEQPQRLFAVALDQVLVLQIPQMVLRSLFEIAPSFGGAFAKFAALRWTRDARPVPLPWYDLAAQPPAIDVAKMLPLAFIERQRVLPVRSAGNLLTIGFVDDLTSKVMTSVLSLVQGMEIVPVTVDATAFNAVLGALQSADAAEKEANSPSGGAAGAAGASGAAAGAAGGATGAGPSTSKLGQMKPAVNVVLSAPKLNPMLKRMVAEGASDLHLCAGHRPRFRIDGEVREIVDAKVLNDIQVYELLEPGMPQRNRDQFLTDNDTDFAYSLPEVARFRVNVFRDHLGIGAVLRQIPQKILTLEQLGLPQGVQRMCDNPKGLVLVTGPTGSGKSTTLAAMIDYINRSRRTHIITLEDPIEFVHKSQKALVNQREVGPHTLSFARALRAALREDPDIVLVGELRDQETIQLALETANTGHLVFGTLHTSTAISTIDRIIDVFPHEQQSQIRAVVSEVLKGVVAQTLLRRKGGGRVAALEVLVGSHAVSNLIREGKNHQIFNIMLTSKAQGNMLLNEQLEKLVTDGKVEFDEAIMKSLDKSDFSKRFGKDYFEK